MVRQKRVAGADPVRAQADITDRAMPTANQAKKRGSHMPSCGAYRGVKMNTV